MSHGASETCMNGLYEYKGEVGPSRVYLSVYQYLCQASRRCWTYWRGASAQVHTPHIPHSPVSSVFSIPLSA